MPIPRLSFNPEEGVMKRFFISAVMAMVLAFSGFAFADAFQDPIGLYSIDGTHVPAVYSPDSSDPTDTAMPVLGCSDYSGSRSNNVKIIFNPKSWQAVAWYGDSFSPRLAQVPIFTS